MAGNDDITLRPAGLPDLMDRVVATYQRFASQAAEAMKPLTSGGFDAELQGWTGHGHDACVSELQRLTAALAWIPQVAQQMAAVIQTYSPKLRTALGDPTARGSWEYADSNAQACAVAWQELNSAWPKGDPNYPFPTEPPASPPSADAYALGTLSAWYGQIEQCRVYASSWTTGAGSFDISAMQQEAQHAATAESFFINASFSYKASHATAVDARTVAVQQLAAIRDQIAQAAATVQALYVPVDNIPAINSVDSLAPSTADFPLAPPPAPATTTHTVVAGESLWSLSGGDPRRWHQILLLNSAYAKGQMLPVGAQVTLPSALPTSPDGGSGYQVQRNDTPQSIAATAGVTVTALLAFNPKVGGAGTPSWLYQGETVEIPPAGWTPPPPPSSAPAAAQTESDEPAPAPPAPAPVQAPPQAPTAQPSAPSVSVQMGPSLDFGGNNHSLDPNPASAFAGVGDTTGVDPIGNYARMAGLPG